MPVQVVIDAPRDAAYIISNPAEQEDDDDH
jgi:hypothetical protein